MVFSRNRTEHPVVAPTYFVPINGHGKLLIPLGVRELWLYLQPDNIFLPAHLRLLLLAFPHFSAKEPHDQTNATRRAT